MTKKISRLAAAICSAIVVAAVALTALMTTPAKALTSTENTIVSYLRGQGFGSVQIAAIIGNIYAESSCNPNAYYYPGNSANEFGYGLFQYTHSAYDCATSQVSTTYGTCELCSYLRWCNNNGYAYDNVSAQLYWTFQGGGYWRSRWVNRGSYYTSVVRSTSAYAQLDTTSAAFCSESDLASATYSWMACYEGPSSAYCNYSTRISKARSVLAAMVAPGWFVENGSYHYFYSNGSLAYGWLQYGGKWYYFNGYSNLVVSDWVQSSGSWYYMGSSGAMLTNSWVLYKGKYYYMNSGGKLVANGWVLHKGKYYYMKSNGNPVTNGWVLYKGKYYYMNSAGNPMMDAWLVYKGKYFYLNHDGNPVADAWLLYKEKYYYMNHDGNPVVDAWLLYEDKYYYLDAAGNPMTDAWLLYDGRRYYMDAAGNPVCDAWVEDADGSRYYMDAAGNPVCDAWVEDADGSRYYMDAAGNPVCDGWVEDADGNRWYLDENGVCVEADPTIPENAQTV